FESKAPLLIADVQTNPGIENQDFYRRHGLVSYLGVPLIAKEEVLGVLSFYTTERYRLTSDEVEFLTTLVGQTAIAIHDAQLAAHLPRRRHVGQRPPVRAAEPKLAVGRSIELVALLVNGAVVAATEHGEIRERGGAPLGPVTDVMALPEPDPAAREPAAAVAVMERPPEGRRDRARSSRDLDD